VLLRSVEAEGFLSYGRLVRLEVGPGLTVVTGPNAAGKSNLGRCLDVVRAVVQSASGDAVARQRLELYKDAGYEGAVEFTIRLGVDLDQEWEQDLIRTFVRACFAVGGSEKALQEVSAAKLDELAGICLSPDSLAPLWSGSLVVRHRAAAWPWSGAWEFGHAGDAWHAVLAGTEGLGQLRPGTADHPTGAPGAGPFTDWLVRSMSVDGEPDPSDLPLRMDFRAAMLQADAAVSFAASGRAGEVPDSLRELGSALGVDPANQHFGFGQVLGLLMRRGIVLTDNRRLPLERLFNFEDLGRETDLRDGSAVAAELFRLRLGLPEEQARYAEICASFQELTGRELGLRARPDRSGDGSMIVEPTVTGFHGERLVELSGAGVQEALVLAALLGDRPGRVTVLDEPAVNLEPTAQRRLLRRVRRGPGQFVVITHSADLVPFDEPEDLRRVVRVAPVREGSQLCQPDFGGAAERELLRQLQLMAPAEVRGLLFAAGVILCEGQTESGALPCWWRDAGPGGFPGLEAYGVCPIAVMGSGEDGAIRFLLVGC
jgi:hypothetical protein